MKKQPERYQNGRSLTPVEVLAVLRTYLSDALGKIPAEKKRIAVQNKRFLLAFSDDCDDIFKYLEFGLQFEPAPDGVSVNVKTMDGAHLLLGFWI
jgi:ubiquitin carboxyl-terminal hydrolase 25